MGRGDGSSVPLFSIRPCICRVISIKLLFCCEAQFLSELIFRVLNISPRDVIIAFANMRH